MTKQTCAICGDTVLSGSKIKKEFVTRNYGDDKNQRIKIICKNCDRKNAEMYRTQ